MRSIQFDPCRCSLDGLAEVERDNLATRRFVLNDRSSYGLLQAAMPCLGGGFKPKSQDFSRPLVSLF